MTAHLGTFTFPDIAYALARLPGRLQIDHEEANRILDDIAQRYDRGYFADDEVMVQVAPGQFELLKTVLESAQGRGEPGLPLAEIRVCGILTFAAAKRYVQESRLAGATRLLDEWSDAAPASGASVRSPPKTRRRPGPKPVLREAIIKKMLADLCAGRRTPEQLQRDTLYALKTQYGGSVNTTGTARKEALERFAEFQNSNSEANS